VFGGLDFPVTRTDDPRLNQFLSNVEAVRKAATRSLKTESFPRSAGWWIATAS
jgi:hypothetical protein